MEYRELAGKLTLRQKALLLTGGDFWHTNEILEYAIPGLMMTDGPNGLRKEEKLGKLGRRTAQSVCYPSAAALASSWDRSLLAELGSLLADECRRKRVSLLLGPGLNIKRSPLCGRNFEYYSEDPVLSGELAASFISALQAGGTGACPKHFAANNTETRRMVSNSVVDERALHEIYLRGFEIAVRKAKPWALMCAYNKLNGVYCTENKYLLADILRGRWGFDGLTLSDWLAVNDRISALDAGLDLEMPSSGYENVRAIARACRRGELSPEKAEESAQRVLEFADKALPYLKEPCGPAADMEAHHSAAEKMAGSCAVLLKNEGLLPLSRNQRVAIIGERAKYPLYQGGGSAQINSYREDSALDALYAENARVVYADGYMAERPNDVNERLIASACALAAECDAAVVFVSDSEANITEGNDRRSISLPLSQTELIKAVCRANPNTAVVTASGSCLEMPWIDAPKAVLQTYLSGEASGSAAASLLLGDIVPSGKLCESYPLSLADTPCPSDYHTDKDGKVLYRESIFVGYRYYEKTGTPVLFPFGHGLSYTEFKYSGLSLSSDRLRAGETLTLSFDIANLGSCDAAEVAQIYVAKKDSAVFRAVKELKEFTKVSIAAASSARVTVVLDGSAFEYYDTGSHSWQIEDGEYEIYIGSSSADIRLSAKLFISSNERVSADRTFIPDCYFSGNIKKASDEDFEELLGRPLSSFDDGRTDDRVTASDTLLDTVHTKYGYKLTNFLYENLQKKLADNPALMALAYNTAVNIPLKRFAAASKGIVSESGVDAFVHLLNSSSVSEALKVAACGIPQALLNAIFSALRRAADKKSRE